MSDSGSDESVRDDSVNNLEAIVGQLIVAIRTGRLGEEDLENRLREILAPLVVNDDIYSALYVAARNGSVVACRILWGKLSRRVKRKYSKGARVHDNGLGPLHAAAMNGHLEVVRLLTQNFKWNTNQKNCYDYTPLCYAVQHLDIVRFLLENGANVNEGGKYGPLWFAVQANNTEVSRLLLVEYQANPNLNRSLVDEDSDDSFDGPNLRNTDLAIFHGNEEILRMLLQHDAFIGYSYSSEESYGTSLNFLLCDERKNRETKLVICRILMEHHANNKNDYSTTMLIQASFEFAITHPGNSGCHQILLDAGMDARMAMYCAIRSKNLSVCQLLVHEYQVDPFYNDDEPAATTAASPFLATARPANTSILEYFLGIWNELFASTNSNKNSNGDYPIHVVCCDPLVSLQAIKMLVNRQAEALAVVDGEQGLLPFHFAANWDASLDVIFYLLQHCPNALCHGGNVVPATAMIETKDDDDVQQNAPRGPAKKKTKTSHIGH